MWIHHVFWLTCLYYILTTSFLGNCQHYQGKIFFQWSDPNRGNCFLSGDGFHAERVRRNTEEKFWTQNNQKFPKALIFFSKNDCAFLWRHDVTWEKYLDQPVASSDTDFVMKTQIAQKTITPSCLTVCLPQNISRCNKNNHWCPFRRATKKMWIKQQMFQEFLCCFYFQAQGT